MGGAISSPIQLVVPDTRSEAERRSGIHSHRAWFGEDSRWQLSQSRNPVVMDPGSAL